MPLFVDPLGVAAEASLSSEPADFSGRIFVAAFGPDGLTCDKIDNAIGLGDRHPLVSFGAQVHFYTAFVLVEADRVLELRQVKISVQFAIDASQQIQIEGCGDAQRIVVGIEQLGNRLLQVGPQQQRVAGLQDS